MVDSNVTHIQDYVLSVGRRGEIVLVLYLTFNRSLFGADIQYYEPVVLGPL